MPTSRVRRARGSRWPLLPFCMLLGAAFAGVDLANHKTSAAIFAMVLLTAFGFVLAFSRSEWVVAGTGHGDERQRAINADAVQFTYVVVVCVAVIGALVDLSHGKYGEFGIIASVGGFTYLAALAFLRRRR